MNLPNIISLARIPALFLISSLLLTKIPYISTICFFLFVLAALTDILDGYVARAYNQVSNIGKFLDALIDKIFIIGMFATLFAIKSIPSYGVLFVLLIISREFLVTGLRIIAASKNFILSAEKAGKLKSFCQNFSIGSFIFVRAVDLDFIHYCPNWLHSTFYFLQMLFLIVASLLTFTSGYTYMKKYGHLLKED